MSEVNLQKLFDKALFPILRKNGGFFGPIVGSLRLKWYVDTPSAWAHTDGFSLNINPDRFVALSDEGRTTLIYHETRHVSDLHMLRRGDRDHKIWNLACDIKINLEAKSLGYSFHDFMSRADTLDPKYQGLSEERIYEMLIEDGMQPDPENEDIVYGAGGTPLSEQQRATLINRVVSAHISSGTNSAAVQEYIDKLLKPSVDFRVVLREFFSALGRSQLNWKRRNRRYQNTYLPKRIPQRDGLRHLAYYVDTSGSITQEQIEQVHTDLYELWWRHKPEKMTVVTFDTEIASETTFTKAAPYTKLDITARGGTNMQCVYDHIIATRPSAAIIFSDNECYPIDDPGIPIVWLISVPKPYFLPTFGRIAYV